MDFLFNFEWSVLCSFSGVIAIDAEAMRSYAWMPKVSHRIRLRIYDIDLDIHCVHIHENRIAYRTKSHQFKVYLSM